MKKIGLIFIFLVFLAGCATTPHVSGRGFSVGLLGAAIGGAIAGEKGAIIGGAAGYGLGTIWGTEEELSGRTLVPASTIPGGGGYLSSGAPGYVDCSTFSTKKEQAECERGKRAAERELQRELERRAYERGRYGY